MIKRMIPVLSVLLVAQIGLAVALNYGSSDHGAFKSEEKLVAGLVPNDITEIRIQGAEDETVTLARKGERWVLPQIGDYPADQGKVDRLFEKFEGFKKSWPVATSSSAAERFKVAPGAFERKLVFVADGNEMPPLYIGSSPAFRQVHLRLDGQDDVYAVAFSAYDAGAKTENWEDRDFLNWGGTELLDTVAFPGFTLKHEEDTFELVGDARAVDQAKVKALAKQATNLRFKRVLGTEAQPEYNFDNPALAVTLKNIGGEEITYEFAKLEENTFVLKTSNHPYYFEVSEWSIDELLEADVSKVLSDESTSDQS